MKVSNFLRNWAYHYIEPIFLYLPRQREIKKGIIIRPTSYVHSNYFTYGQYSSNQYQYFYVDYQSPLPTGTLIYEQKELGSKESKNRAQYPCLYRIYEYDQDKKKYIPIDVKGKRDYECSKKTLYKNEQKFNLITNKHYFYSELQSSDGDILHFNIEEFWIDKKGYLQTKNNNLNEIRTFLEPVKDSDESQFVLEIRHYPKLVKIYSTFAVHSEKSIIKEVNDLANFTAYGYLGTSDIEEPWTNAVAGESSAQLKIEPSILYKVYPKVEKITYLEKEIPKVLSQTTIKETPLYELIPYKLEQITQGHSSGGGGWGASIFGWTKVKSITKPEPTNANIFINKILVHSGDEIEWTDTNHPQYERYSDPETRQYGHYFSEIPQTGYETADIEYASKSLIGYDNSSIDIWGTFWKKKVPNIEWQAYTKTLKTEKIWESENGTSWTTKNWYEAPFTTEKTMMIKTEGKDTQDIDMDYSKVEGPLVRFKVIANEFTVEKTTVYHPEENVKSLSQTVREKQTGYAWAGAEDIAGMASWCAHTITKLDPDGSYSNPYTGIGCGEGMPLYIAFAQYENTKTKDFTEDSYFLTQNYSGDNPLLPNDSPIKRKGKKADNDVSYAIYDENKFEEYTSNCDAGCSVLVSFIKSTREGYKKYFQTADNYDSSEWLKNKEDLKDGNNS